MTLVETGSPALIGTVFGPTSEGETAYARRLLHRRGQAMLVLRDKGFDANVCSAAVAAAGAQFLGRLRANRRTPVLSTCKVKSPISRYHDREDAPPSAPRSRASKFG
ncbi:hypothetical protein [Streptomyces sp900116325]|uniref:hypothetical protein n=1 Tax=Streptomyces sp. 900116325 TaxID=3154295 RepID=UPI0033B3D350